MLRSDRKPPLARSPIRLRSRRPLQPTANNVQIPPPSPGCSTKTQLPKRAWDLEELDLRPEYRTISCEFKVLAKMVQEEFGDDVDLGNASGFAGRFGENRSPLFERGRLYDEYSARRNERLKRKKGETGDAKKPVYDLGVRLESAKKRESTAKKTAVPSTPMTIQREKSRYLLRSSVSKENKKPPLAADYEKSAGIGQKKTGARRVRQI